MVARICGLIGFLFFALSVHAAESNTVPSNELTADFTISPSDDGSAAIPDVYLTRTWVEDGKVNQDEVVLSADEIITISVNGISIQYDPLDSSKNQLPLTPGSDYAIEFHRADGEVFHSTLRLPFAMAFTSPGPGSVFKKSDAVVAAWNAVESDMSILFLSVDCSPSDSDLTWGEYSLEFNAGWASKCAGPVGIALENLNVLYGTGYGTVVGVSPSAVDFSYEGEVPVPRRHRPKDFNRRLMKAIKSGQRLIRL